MSEPRKIKQSILIGNSNATQLIITSTIKVQQVELIDKKQAAK